MKHPRRNHIYIGNVMDIVPTFQDESIDMIMTSPPYWAQRDYQTKPVIWGGDTNCNHEWHSVIIPKKRGKETGDWIRPSTSNAAGNQEITSEICKCGAWRGELGLEPYINMYIDHLCSVFDAIYPKLKETGTLWVNLGDTYYGSGQHVKAHPKAQAVLDAAAFPNSKRPTQNKELSNKCLSAIPYRFVVEMINRGWIFRFPVVWRKPNAMPLSVKDNFTLDYEFLFLFAKHPTAYYFVQQLEPYADSTKERLQRRLTSMPPVGGKKYEHFDKCSGRDVEFADGRNMRGIWDIPSRSYAGPHYATFPHELVETPLAAGCPEYVCSKCGAPKRKVIVREPNHVAFNIRVRDVKKGRIKYHDRFASEEEVEAYNERAYKTKKDEHVVAEGCDCDAEFLPGLILDPFMGIGTTGAVAQEYGRDYVGIDIDPNTIDYAKEEIVENQTRLEDHMEL